MSSFQLSSDRMMDLMALADGELEGEEKERALALVARDPEAARFVSQITDLGSLVRDGHGERHAAAIAEFDVADRVVASLASSASASSGAPEASASRVASLEEARKKREKRVIAGAVVAALALAASVFLFTRPPEETPMAKGPAVPPPAPTVTVATAASAGVEVQALQSPGQSVKVFYGPAANELTTSVIIWVDDTAEK